MTSLPPDADPPRLFGSGDLPPALGDALREARADFPNESALSELASRLGPLVPPLGAPELPAPPAPPTPPPMVIPPLPLAPLVSGKLVAVVLAASVVVGVPLAYQARSDAPPRTPTVATAASSTSMTIGATREQAPAVESAVPVASTSSKPTAAPRTALPMGAVPTTAEGAGADGADEGAPKETEGQLLRRAHDALASDPARALALTDDHTRRFPGGMLGQERELLAIEALVRMGRVGQARVRAASFLQRFPESAHARRVRTLVPGMEGMGEEPK